MATREDVHQKTALAHRAYEQWLTNKRLQDKEIAREKLVQKELSALRKGQQLTQQERAQISFDSWKRSKDTEMQLRKERQLEWKRGESEVCVSPSPGLTGGYCSVWACDEELADHVLAVVHREHQSPSPI